MKRRDAPLPGSREHNDLMRYALAAGLSIDEARLKLAQQRHAEAMAKLTRKMEAHRA